ncbi:hypothetical protein PY365_20260 [Roseiarcaceae bacterium H3SJ34-1]|uniref:hypothetical protein n=1 Tax=Terripilifer ovatus TaxID=3032367 RepID=UPI003AB9319A|nr:hypothetical protein [Roseiarcaceae bacterium H3SJ34-1]
MSIRRIPASGMAAAIRSLRVLVMLAMMLAAVLPARMLCETTVLSGASEAQLSMMVACEANKACSDQDRDNAIHLNDHCGCSSGFIVQQMTAAVRVSLDAKFVALGDQQFASHPAAPLKEPPRA